MTARVGCAGLVPAGDEVWTQLEVTGSAGADEAPLEGTVVLELAGERVAPALAGRCLPGGSFRVRLPVPARLIDRARLTVLADDGQVRWREPLPPLGWATLEPDRPLAVSLGAPALVALRSATGHDAWPRLANMTPQGLCLEPRVLEGLDAIVLKEDPTGSVRAWLAEPAAAAALRGYVAGGGRLIVLADPAHPAPFWEGTELAGLLPLLPRLAPGATVRPADELLPLLGPVEAEQVAVALLSPRDEAQVEGLREAPLLVSWELGAGRVTVLGFDPDLAELCVSPGAGVFQSRLVGRRPHPVALLDPAAVSRLARQVWDARETLGAAGFAFLAAVVALHLLALGPLSALAGRRFGPWASFLLPPAASLLLAALVLLGGWARREPPQLRQLLVACQLLDGRASLQLEASLSAGPSAQAELTVPPGLLPPLGSGRDLAELDVLALREPAPRLLLGAPGRPRRLGPLHVPAGGIVRLGFTGPSSSALPAGLVLPPPRAELRGAGDAVEVPVELEPGESPTGERWLLALGLTESRFGRLAPAAPGERPRWDPRQAAQLPAPESSPLALDPYLDPAGRAALALAAARLLEEQYHRVVALPDRVSASFPAVWLIEVSLIPEPQPPLLAPADGPDLPAPLLRVDCSALEALR